MGEYVDCKGKTFHDCLDCGRYSSSYSLHYDKYLGRKVSEITCGIAGNRQFDEDGNEV